MLTSSQVWIFLTGHELLLGLSVFSDFMEGEHFLDYTFIHLVVNVLFL